MIDPRELRIGNTILCNGKELTVAINTIQEIIQYRIKPPETRKDKWDPIALTGEWLERFGFEDKTYQDGYIGIDPPEFGTQFVLSKPNHIVKSCYYYHWNYKQDRWPMFNELKYVHQLQNLYFCLTGKELTLK